MKFEDNYLLEHIDPKTSRNNSCSKEKFAFISKRTCLKKVEDFKSRLNKDKINENLTVKNEYGLGRQNELQKEKYFTGINVNNKLCLKQLTGLTSEMGSPRNEK